MPDFHRMAQAAFLIDLEPGAAGDAMIVLAREFQRGLAVAGQQREEGLDARAVEAEIGRELPENRTELWPQPQQTLREEIRETRFGIAQFHHMRDVARALHREDEILRRLLGPAREILRPLQRIMRAVDLNGAEGAAGIGKLALMRQFRRIEDAAPTGVVPAGNADADVAKIPPRSH